MSTIDTSSIEGFDAMSPEQKVEALTKFQIPEAVDLSGYVRKDEYERISTELTQAQEKLQKGMSPDDAARAQAEKEMKDLQKKYDELLKKSTIAEHKASYLAMPGYDESLAQEAAEALFAGDTGKLFTAQKKAAEAHEKAMKAEILKSTPAPGGGGGESGGGEPENVAQARELGKKRAQAMKASENIFGKYKL